MNPLSRLSAAFLREHPQAAAHVLEDFPAESVARFLTGASHSTAQEILRHFTPGFAANCLVASEATAAGSMLADMLPDFQVMVLRQLDAQKRQALLDSLPAEQAGALRRLLPYPDGTAGALMRASVASVPGELTVRQAIKRVKRMHRGTRSYIYVVDNQRQLIGVMTLHELINALSSSSVTAVMHRRVHSLLATEPLRSVARNPYWQEFHALPVIDDNGVLLGVVRQQSVRRFQEQALQSGAITSGLNAFMSVGGLFSLSAGYLLAALITAGTPLHHRNRRG